MLEMQSSNEGQQEHFCKSNMTILRTSIQKPLNIDCPLLHTSSKTESLWATSRDTVTLKPSHGICFIVPPSAHHAVPSRARRCLPTSSCNNNLRA
jgi:hypothetical protein